MALDENEAHTPLLIKAIIFDHDGTLVDSEPAHHKAWQHTLAPFNVELPRSTYQTELSGKPTIQSAHRLVQEHQLNISPEVLCETKMDAIRNHIETNAFPLIDGVNELLRWLAQTPTRIALASGAANHEVAHSLKAHTISQYFETIATKDNVQNNKPAPDVYLHAANALKVAPTQCIAVEDSDSGQLSATAAGMYCLRLDTFTRLEPHPRCYTIPQISDISGWLQKYTVTP